MESYGDMPGAKHLDQYDTLTCVPATLATQIFSQAKERTGGKVVFDQENLYNCLIAEAKNSGLQRMDPHHFNYNTLTIRD